MLVFLTCLSVRRRLTLQGARLFMMLGIMAGVAAWFPPGVCAEDPFGKAVFLTDERIQALRTRIAQQDEPTYGAWLRLEANAQRNLGREPHAPEHWFVPGFYVDGEDGRAHRAAKQVLQDDANIAYELALAYHMADETSYARTAVSLINGWTEVQTLSQEQDSTLSFSYHFPPLIYAADLLKGFPGFPQDDQERFKAFVREKALPQNTMSRANNWGNWGLLLVISAASYLEDRELFDESIARWKELIASQIAEDGSLPHEIRRGTRAVWYTNFTLFPHTLAAEVARVNGVDLYDYRAPNGRTLWMAYETVAPWIRFPETYPFEPKSHNTYISYFEILVLRWPNPDAQALLESHRPLTATHGAPYLTFTHGGFVVPPLNQ